MSIMSTTGELRDFRILWIQTRAVKVRAFLIDATDETCARVWLTRRKRWGRGCIDLLLATFLLDYRRATYRDLHTYGYDTPVDLLPP